MPDTRKRALESDEEEEESGGGGSVSGHGHARMEGDWFEQRL
jgi:hypothetical protein